MSSATEDDRGRSPAKALLEDTVEKSPEEGSSVGGRGGGRIAVVRTLESVLILLAFFGSGSNCALIGQILVDLERQTNSSTEQVSVLFVCRGAGIIAGCLAASWLCGRLHHRLLLAASVVTIGVCQMIIPAATHLVAAGAVFLGQAVSVGLLSTVGIFVLVKLWGAKASPFVHAVFFTYDIAACLCPLLQQIFIEKTTTTTTSTTTSSQPEQTGQPDRSKLFDGVSGRARMSTTPSGMENSTVVSADYRTDLLALNLVVGSYIVLPGFIFLAMSLCSKGIKAEWPTQDMNVADNSAAKDLLLEEKDTKDYHKEAPHADGSRESPQGAPGDGCCGGGGGGRDYRELTRVVLFGVMLAFIFSADAIVVSLSVLYMVEGLYLTLNTAMYVASIRAFAAGGLRFVVMLSSRVINARLLVVVTCAVSTAGLLGMAVALHVAPPVDRDSTGGHLPATEDMDVSNGTTGDVAFLGSGVSGGAGASFGAELNRKAQLVGNWTSKNPEDQARESEHLRAGVTNLAGGNTSGTTSPLGTYLQANEWGSKTVVNRGLVTGPSRSSDRGRSQESGSPGETYLGSGPPMVVLSLLVASSATVTTLYASALTWASQEVTITPTISAVFNSPFAVGFILGPTLASQLLEAYGVHWFIYVLVLYMLFIDGIIVVVLILRQLWPHPTAVTRGAEVNQQPMKTEVTSVLAGSVLSLTSSGTLAKLRTKSSSVLLLAQ